MAKQRSTNSDAETFRAAVRDVTPLAQTTPTAGLARPKPRARLRAAVGAATENLDETMPLVGGEVVTGEGTLTFCARRGAHPSDAPPCAAGSTPSKDELDLHGLSQSAARDQLADFIARSRDGRPPLRESHSRQRLSLGSARPGTQNGGESLVAPAHGCHGIRVSASDRRRCRRHVRAAPRLVEVSDASNTSVGRRSRGCRGIGRHRRRVGGPVACGRPRGRRRV